MTKTMLLAAAAFALPTIAFAGTGEDTQIVMAAGACQSALPVFDGVVRKRPLAVQNEGTTPAFITCGLEGKFGAVVSSSVILVGLVNNSASSATVNCTLVDGREGLSDPVYRPKSVMLPANTQLAELVWANADNEGVNFIYPAISCSLPPGTGIKAVGQAFLAPAP